MKLNGNFIIKEMAGSWILVPFGDKAIDFNGVVTLNETAKFLYEKCADGIDENTLKNALIAEYEIDDTTAENAVNTFIDQLKEAGCIDE